MKLKYLLSIGCLAATMFISPSDIFAEGAGRDRGENKADARRDRGGDVDADAARPKGEAKKGSKRGNSRRHCAKKDLRRLMHALDLSDEQLLELRELLDDAKAEMAAYLEEHAEELEALRLLAKTARENKDREAFKEVKALLKAFFDEAPKIERIAILKSVLDDDQLAKLKKIIKNCRCAKCKPKTKRKTKRDGAKSSNEEGKVRGARRGR